jgi:hypothetical protein
MLLSVVTWVVRTDNVFHSKAPFSKGLISDLYTGFQLVGLNYLKMMKKWNPVLVPRVHLGFMIISSAVANDFSSAVIRIDPLCPAALVEHTSGLSRSWSRAVTTSWRVNSKLPTKS